MVLYKLKQWYMCVCVTFPAMNCPKPGGKVSVEISTETRAEYKKQLDRKHMIRNTHTHTSIVITEYKGNYIIIYYYFHCSTQWHVSASLTSSWGSCSWLSASSQTEWSSHTETQRRLRRSHTLSCRQSKHQHKSVRHNHLTTARGIFQKSHWPHRSEDWKLLKVEGKVQPVLCCIKSRERLWERE